MLASNGMSTAARNRSKSASSVQRLGEDQVGAGVGVGAGAVDRGGHALDAGGVGAGADRRSWGHAARIPPRASRFTMSAAGTTALPSRCPHRFGLTWSSMWHPASPASSSRVTVRAALSGSPNPVSASISVGRSVAPAICAPRVGDLGQRRQPDVGQSEVGRQRGAGHVDPLEADLGDDLGHQRRERARKALQPTGIQTGPQCGALVGGAGRRRRWPGRRSSEDPRRNHRRLVQHPRIDPHIQRAQRAALQVGKRVHGGQEPLLLSGFHDIRRRVR